MSNCHTQRRTNVSVKDRPAHPTAWLGQNSHCLKNPGTWSALVKHPRFRCDQPPVFPEPENTLIPALPGRRRRRNEAGPWDGESVSECLAAFSRFFNFFRENRLVRMGPSLGQIWNLANLA